MQICLSTTLPLRRNPGLALGLLLVPAVLLQVLLPAAWTYSCRFFERTGCPCPSCGATRCFQLALKGEFAEAFAMQPLLFVTALLFLGWMAYTLMASFIHWPSVRIRFQNKTEIICAFGLCLLLITFNWIYLILVH